MSADTSYPPALPQDPIVELLPNLYLLRGSCDVMPGVSINRNMVILRQSNELSLIGSVRMTPDNEQALAHLGEVAHLVRIGGHDMDMEYTIARYKPKLWCVAGAETDVPLGSNDSIASFDTGTGLPCLDADVLPFRGISIVEVGLLWREHGGVLITSDALQHYGDWRFFNLRSRLVHPLMGFRRGMIVGPIWHRLLTTDESATRDSFDALLDQSFRHMIGLHGTFCRDVAKDKVRDAIHREFVAGPAMSNLAFRIVERQVSSRSV
jgi:hypothetical protein